MGDTVSIFPVISNLIFLDSICFLCHSRIQFDLYRTRQKEIAIREIQDGVVSDNPRSPSPVIGSPSLSPSTFSGVSSTPSSFASLEPLPAFQILTEEIDESLWILQMHMHAGASGTDANSIGRQQIATQRKGEGGAERRGNLPQNRFYKVRVVNRGEVALVVQLGGSRERGKVSTRVASLPCMCTTTTPPLQYFRLLIFIFLAQY